MVNIDIQISPLLSAEDTVFHKNDFRNCPFSTNGQSYLNIRIYALWSQQLIVATYVASATFCNKQLSQ